MVAISWAETSAGISANPGSAAVISLTNSMTAAMLVLKCQRPAKSWVILRDRLVQLTQQRLSQWGVGRGRRAGYAWLRIDSR